MFRSCSVMSVVVFAAACGGGRSSRPVGPSPLGDVPVKAWPRAGAQDLAWRVSGKPAYVVITVGGSDAAAIVWVTSDGSDLAAAYCVDREQLEEMRSTILKQRGARHDGFMELEVQPDKHTDVCASAARPHPTAPASAPLPPPPLPEAPSLTTAAAVRCPSATATCNFVIPNPQQKGPGGEPPMPDIVWKLDQILWNKQVFVNRIATHVGGRG